MEMKDFETKGGGISTAPVSATALSVISLFFR